MTETFHVRVTVKTKDGKSHSYVKDNVYYKDRKQAVSAGEDAFQNTLDVVMVEVFQAGVANPIALFH